MEASKRVNDAVYEYLKPLKARVVAESGIKSDECHIGKLLLRSLKDTHDFVLQFRKIGLKTGDVIDFMITNHFDLTAALYAAMYLGVMVTQTAWTYTLEELRHSFKTTKTKLVFCHPNKVSTIREALDAEKLTDTRIMTMGEGDTEFRSFIKYNGGDCSVDDFRAADFDTTDTISHLVPTSGTTGFPKLVCLTHKNYVVGAAGWWNWEEVFPSPTRLMLITSPFQWISTVGLFAMSGILKFTRVQSSNDFSFEMLVDVIEQYKPSCMVFNPPLLIRFGSFLEGRNVDLSCFEYIIFGGAAVTSDIIAEFDRIFPNATPVCVYGLSEASGPCMTICYRPSSRLVGKPFPFYQYRLVSPDTGLVINEPNVPGELWIKSDSVFKGYYNNDKATSEILTEDGWLRTGDILYRDEDNTYYYVDRYKLMYKYRMHHISPVELEGVIRSHPGVEDVVVGALPDPESGELPVACVKRKEGGTVTAEEIKELVKSKLSEPRQLHGGVIFLDTLPTTFTSKIDRKKISEIVRTMPRE